MFRLAAVCGRSQAQQCSRGHYNEAMSQLPLAEYGTQALQRRRRELARAGLDPGEINRNRIIPRLNALDWTAILGDAPEPGKLLRCLLSPDQSSLLSRERLREWSRAGIAYDPVLRGQDVKGLFPGHEPVGGAFLEGKLERFFEWSASPAFQDLEPVLQLSLTQLRLLELLPFEQHSAILGFWFGVIPLLREGFLLPSYDEGGLDEFPEALRRGFEFETIPLVALNLDAVLRSYEEALG